MLKVVPQLDVEKKQKKDILDNSLINLSNEKSEKEIKLEKYTSFFRKNLSRLADYTDPNYLALEIMNDEGLLVSEHMKDLSNFKVCHASLIETLLDNPAKLSEIKLVHAVMPFDEVYPIVKMLAKIPEVSNADTRIIFGAYDNYEDDIHEYNRRVLRGLMNSLDFNGYHMADIDGTSVKMVYSTYQKNLRMRH